MKLSLAGAALALLFLGCPASSPRVPSPDASDAQAVGDSPALTGCPGACAHMRVLGCVVQDNCSAVLPGIVGMIRNAKTGMPLTCDDLIDAGSVQDIKAMGQPCGP